MTDQPQTCYRCQNPIEHWQPFVRRIAGHKIDVKHANPSDCLPTPKPKEVK